MSMTNGGYRPPNARSIVLGIILFVVLILTLCSLSEVTKTAGSLLMFLPSRLGWIEPVHRADVQRIDLNPPPPELQFMRPGRYAVYTIDYDLLVITDQLMNAEEGHPWLKLTGPDGQALPVAFVRRGLLPFDSPLAKGRPVFTFIVPQAGSYRLTTLNRPVEIGIVPDVTTGREGLILFLFAAQLLILAVPVISWIQRNRRLNRQRVAEVVQLKRIRGDEFWQSEAERRKKKSAARWR
jgi:hypothetical protein